MMKRMKEIQELNKWRAIPCSWIGRLNTVKMSVLPNLSYRFNTTPIRTNKLLYVYHKLILKLKQVGKRPRRTNTVLKEKNKVRVTDTTQL